MHPETIAIEQTLSDLFGAIATWGKVSRIQPQRYCAAKS
jgi:hypothetical protein